MLFGGACKFESTLSGSDCLAKSLNSPAVRALGITGQNARTLAYDPRTAAAIKKHGGPGFGFAYSLAPRAGTNNGANACDGDGADCLPILTLVFDNFTGTLNGDAVFSIALDPQIPLFEGVVKDGNISILK